MKIFYGLDEDRNVSNISTIKSDSCPYQAELTDPLDPDKLAGYQPVNGQLIFDQELWDRKQGVPVPDDPTMADIIAKIEGILRGEIE